MYDPTYQCEAHISNFARCWNLEVSQLRNNPPRFNLYASSSLSLDLSTLVTSLYSLFFQNSFQIRNSQQAQKQNLSYGSWSWSRSLPQGGRQELGRSRWVQSPLPSLLSLSSSLLCLILQPCSSFLNYSKNPRWVCIVFALKIQGWYFLNRFRCV